jgi:hypothetical protein
MPHKLNWLITQHQISKLSFEDAILPVDPEQLCDAQIFNLRGTVRLRVEGVTGPADLFTLPGPRKFFQALHQRWPYSAYFLRVNPVTPDSVLDEIIDLSLFMALALCNVQQLSFVETARGNLLQYDGRQLSAHLDELVFRASELAGVVDYPATAIARRETLISHAVASFFEAGKALQQKPKNRNKKT